MQTELARMVELRCEGSCDPCIGIVRTVDVVGWCQFDYCQAAIDEDRGHGLTVVERANPTDFYAIREQPQSRAEWESKGRYPR